MKKGLKGLLVALIAVGSATASETYNKTHMNVRISRDSVPAFTTFHEMTHVNKAGGFGWVGRGNVEFTGFYGRSYNGSHLARNFYPKCQEYINVLSQAADYSEVLAQSPNVYNELLLHAINGVSPLAGTITFEPRQTVIGGRLDYFQRLDKWMEGLYFHLIVPIVQVTNDINMKVSNSTPHSFSQEAGDTSLVHLEEIFSGKDIARPGVDGQNSNEPNNKNQPLLFSKMCNNQKSGLGDIEAKIGWRFLEGHKYGDKYHAGVNLGVVFPTGSEQNAKYYWGAQTGESKWGISLGADGSAALWEEEEQNLKIFASFVYKYLFSGNERRTFGLREFRYSATGLLTNPMLSQYYLVGTKNVPGLQPLANLTTMCTKVEPGSQFDAIVDFAYNNGGFTLDLGYNLFWKEAERIPEFRFKGCGVCSTTECTASCATAGSCMPWVEETYAVAGPDYTAGAAFTLNDSSTGNLTRGWIKKTDLAGERAEQQAQLVHKFFTGIGYEARSWDYPVMVGAGVAYELPHANRNAAEGYSFWAKAGVAF